LTSYENQDTADVTSEMLLGGVVRASDAGDGGVTELTLHPSAMRRAARSGSFSRPN
jgi:hypothetical protein